MSLTYDKKTGQFFSYSISCLACEVSIAVSEEAGIGFAPGAEDVHQCDKCGTWLQVKISDDGRVEFIGKVEIVNPD